MIELVKDKQHQVIKRDGRVEEYSEEKLRAVIYWASEGKSVYVDEILQDLHLKIHDQIKVVKLYDTLIETVANKITSMFPHYDTIARNLYLQSIYKSLWGIKRTNGRYPHYSEVLKRGVSAKLYSREVVNSFSEEEVESLNRMIDPSKDFMFDYLGLNIFMDKYSLGGFELPQQGFLRLAIFAFWKEPKHIRLELIKQRYDDLSNFVFSEATPKWINSMRDNAQMASCVVATVDDDSRSINKTISNLGLFSKYGGGLALDISKLRSSGSKISTTGKSSGPIPFIKMLEAAVVAFNQNGVRKGACAVYYNWWHYDVRELLQLKDEGGVENLRARNLQYGFKINRLLLERFRNDEDISLFDPKDVPELIDNYGESFDTLYRLYETKVGIRRKTIKARVLIWELLNQAVNTGNIYLFFTENVHEQTPFKDVIYSSNLCNEIFLPSKPTIFKGSSLSQEYGGTQLVSKEEYDPGMIALCNLSSINIVVWTKMSQTEKERTSYNLLRASDNLINYAYYPVNEGKVSNMKFRSIGVGMSNLAQMLASCGAKFSSNKAEGIIQDLTEDIYFHLTKASVQLAKERGVFEGYYNTKWNEGWLPIDSSKIPLENLKHDWEGLRGFIKCYGVRFATLGAVAPTATSSLMLSATEGVQPVKNLVSDKTGNYSCKQIVPNLNKLRADYEVAWDIPNKTLIKLAAIRQCFIDQGQSTDTFYRNISSASEIIENILYAESVGLKGMYYMNQLKIEEEEACESCST